MNRPGHEFFAHPGFAFEKHCRRFGACCELKDSKDLAHGQALGDVGTGGPRLGVNPVAAHRDVVDPPLAIGAGGVIAALEAVEGAGKGLARALVHVLEELVADTIGKRTIMIRRHKTPRIFLRSPMMTVILRYPPSITGSNS